VTAPTLLAVSHGTSSAEGADAVAGLVAAVADRLDGRAAVAAGFVDVQQPDVPACFEDLGVGGGDGPGGASVVLVPLLLSAGYHVHVDLADDVAAARAAGGDVTLAGALGPDDRLVEVLALRLEQTGLRPDDVVVLAAAGSSDRRALVDCEATAAGLARRLGRARDGVVLAYLSAAEPRLADAVTRARTGGARVVVASYLLAPGYFADLATSAGGDVTTSPLLVAGEPAPVELVDVVVERYAVAAGAALGA
jgi:sirohydrochlorin ferrochelatase